MVSSSADKGIAAAGCVLSLLKAGGNIPADQEWSKNNLGQRHASTKALGASQFSSGGALIPEEVSDELIDLLRDRSVVRSMNPPTMEVAAGRLAIPKKTASSNAFYTAENADIEASEPEFGQVVLDLRKLAALVPVSNDMLRFAGQETVEIIRNDLVDEIATRENSVFINSDGSQGKPQGFRNLADPANITSSNGDTSSDIELDLKELKEGLDGANVPNNSRYWLMNSRSFNTLFILRDSNGNLIFPELRSAQPMIYSSPVLVSNAVKRDLGGSNNESEVFYVEASQLMLGTFGGMEIDVSDNASYKDSGSLVSAFSRDQQVVRALLYHDLQVRHNQGIAVKTGVTWGT